jgi:HSP20 family protein
MNNLVKYSNPLQLRDWTARELPDLFRSLEWPDMASWFDRDSIRLEEIREDDRIFIRAEMPGVDPERDVKVSMEDRTLCIEVQRSEHTESEDLGRVRSEFHYGQFTRRLVLPRECKEDQITATYKDGILEIKIPLDEQAQAATEIPISRD